MIGSGPLSLLIKLRDSPPSNFAAQTSPGFGRARRESRPNKLGRQQNGRLGRLTLAQANCWKNDNNSFEMQMALAITRWTLVLVGNNNLHFDEFSTLLREKMTNISAGRRDDLANLLHCTVG